MTNQAIAHRDPRTRSDGSNIISVASGKGGVGKTWLSVTLSHALANLGRRVLLFDGDIGLANVDIQLALVPERDLSAVLTGTRQLRDVVTPYPEAGLDIVAGRSGSGNLALLPEARRDTLRNDLLALAPDYDDVVVDLAAGIGQTVRHFTFNSATCLVVVTEEPTSLTDAYAFIKLTMRDRPDCRLRIVVNRALDLDSGRRTYQTLATACKNFLGVAPPLAGIIRIDRLVGDAIRHQAPLLSRHPTAQAATDIEVIACHLTDSA